MRRPRVAIHGHFYQPPRENPWTGVVERQASAAPAHDWNERIAAECYLPNLRAGNLERISFNFGPTLLAWADAACPELSSGVAAADRAGAARHGHGPAIAQLFSHPIAPLLGERDRRTQVRWGIADFVRRFGRRPEGMWLPECAVDLASLRTLAEEGIRFTILAPTQAARAREGDGAWRDAGPDGVDPSRPARVDLGGGRSIAVLLYDRDASQAVAFDGALASGDALRDRLKRSAAARGPGSTVLVATDGESYGHHKAGGDAALAQALAALENDPDVELTTPARLLAEEEPARVIEIREASAWSCAHGIGRWRDDCGCRSGPEATHQRWRAPLREAIETLTARIHTIFERAGGEVFRDPWEARDVSGGLPPSALRESETWLRCLRHPEREIDARRALRLLEMERQCLFAHTSCAWFFDDVAGIEAVQNLRFAARAIELSRAGATLEDELLAILRRAPSNSPAYGDAATVYRRVVLQQRIDGLDVVARAAFRWLFAERPAPHEVAGAVALPEAVTRETLDGRALLCGAARLKDAFDRPDEWAMVAAIALGDGESFVFLGRAPDAERGERAMEEIRAQFRSRRLPDLIRAIQLRTPSRYVHQLDLAPDEIEAITRA